MPKPSISAIGNGKYGSTLKADPKDLVHVEVGDVSSPSKFKPHMKWKRWGGEATFAFELDDVFPGNASVTFDGSVITWSKAMVDARWYAYDNDGGFEFEVTLKAKPPRNSVTFTLTDHANLDFHYQPPPTQQELDEGAIRPDNVVGSYAVYHRSKRDDWSACGGQNYMTGKVCHIFRPEAIDANGVHCWGDIAIDAAAGTVTLSLPQAFLDSAKYPVVIDPTFGWATGTGTAQAFTPANAVRASNVNYTPPGNGRLLSYTHYVYNPNALTDRLRYALVDGTSNAIVDYSDILSVPTCGIGWRTISSLVGAAISSSSSYKLAIWCEGTGAYWYYDVGSFPDTMRWLATGAFTDPWPNPIPWTLYVPSARQYSIYASYAPIQYKTLAGSTAANAASIKKRAGKRLQASTFAVFNASITRARKVARVLPASSAAFAATLKRQTRDHTVAAMAAFNAAVKKKLPRKLVATCAAFTATLKGSKTLNKLLTASKAAFTATHKRLPRKRLAGSTQSVSGAIKKRAVAHKLVGATAAASAIVKKRLARKLTATRATFTAALTKRLARKLVASRAAFTATVRGVPWRRIYQWPKRIFG
jgi:hypothetical protein